MARKDEYGVLSRVSAKGRVQIDRKSMMYRRFIKEANSTQKKVMLSLLIHVDNDNNLIQLGGDTLDKIVEDTDLAPKTIRNSVYELRQLGMLDKTVLKNEYYVNPLFAVVGGYIDVLNTGATVENEIRAMKGIDETVDEYPGNNVRRSEWKMD